MAKTSRFTSTNTAQHTAPWQKMPGGKNMTHEEVNLDTRTQSCAITKPSEISGQMAVPVTESDLTKDDDIKEVVVGCQPKLAVLAGRKCHGWVC